MKYVSVCVAWCASRIADTATVSKYEITPPIKGWGLNTEKISFLHPLSRSHVPSEYPFHPTLRERLRRTSFTLEPSFVILLSASTRACRKCSLKQGASARAVKARCSCGTVLLTRPVSQRCTLNGNSSRCQGGDLLNPLLHNGFSFLSSLFYSFTVLVERTEFGRGVM